MNRTKWVVNDWSFKACHEQEWMHAKVPGCVHTDLLANAKIPDPFYGTNEKEVQWIDKQDWEYESHFDLSEELLLLPQLELVFGGLDTYADVTVNGQRVLSADNMFRVWKADVKNILKSSGNTIHIRFRSPVQEDLPKLEKLGYALPASNDQSEVGGLGEQRISVFARKAPYHYGWDWGPRFVTSGIWREVWIEGWEDNRIQDLFIEQIDITPAEALLKAVTEIEAAAEGEGMIRLQTEALIWEQKVMLNQGINLIEIPFVISNPKLWWCRGLGEAHLYEFQVELLQHESLTASRTVTTGLRSAKLVREKDEAGSTFYVELNGVPVFAKGANHIPNDSFITEVTEERYRHEIATAAASNMNMLRVWGGGIYEQDMFYRLCDEYGLMVWQDFMFACSMYPGDEAFLLNVHAEAEENVKRLRNHPSVVIWCGNNEIDTAWSHYTEGGGWGWKQNYTPELRDKIWSDYEKIFHNILPVAVAKHAPGIPYWPSSPMIDLTGDSKQHAVNDSAAGDIHYWGVWHNVEPFENYNIYVGRFMSEYGFQSFPEYKSVRSYAEESDLELESPVMLAHQKNGQGNRLIKQYMDMYMNEPKDFPSFLYMSQVLQAEAMKMAIESHRRRKPYCMGTLYWQMNDCWPVASWAGMDYFGRWKALQYAAKRSFRDIALSIDGTSGDGLDLYVISDQLKPFAGSIHLRVMDMNGAVLDQRTVPISIKPNTSSKVYSAAAEQLLQDRDMRNTFLLAQLEGSGEVLDNQVHYFVPMKELALEQPAIEIHEVEGSGGTVFELSSNKLAKHVWLSSEVEGCFSDNFFDLVPGMPQTVQFSARTESVTAFIPAKPGQLFVKSMTDFIQSR
ncbi:glycoside hydrolase family 2 TIM barrel-domain containing protein [Paenibacillus dokdonensis]|uniref:Beta-mannosidase n=1 Tax=Paenibacillus dokdonensis TaxID=2567944 RepID=A0ABU6GR13_9BACL|nr:glycoside hydrolase family 2 protein [Paenibacillus dokdonensis]MEC0241828.1 glycoside hydrolase family 2 TIM barrel-domain containing protein [Paenibacillus dokdonensis]